MAEEKKLLGLLNGLARHDYYNDSEITDDFLKNELYSDLSDDEFRALVHRSRGLIKSMASSDMDPNQLEVFLNSQVRKKEGGLSEKDSKVYMKFWKTHKNKIHSSLVSACTWNNSLKDLSWRIDVKSKAKHIDQVNAPTAIVEMQVENKQMTQQGSDTLRFEMDENSLSMVLKNLGDIEEQIKHHCET